MGPVLRRLGTGPVGSADGKKHQEASLEQIVKPKPQARTQTPNKAKATTSNTQT